MDNGSFLFFLYHTFMVCLYAIVKNNHPAPFLFYNTVHEFNLFCFALRRLYVLCIKILIIKPFRMTNIS